MKLHQALIAAAAGLVLAACSDSPQEAPPQPEPVREVPTSATTSPTAYAQFAGTLQKSETDEPLDVNKVKPPTSETESPLPL